MGALSSRRDAGAEELDTPPGSVYRYPPKSGNYFASHFIMGGQTFDSAHPEGYLFGENSDLNFLGSHPVIFPYAAPPPQDPVKTLRSLISIRKDTLRLVRCERRCREELQTPTDETTAEETPDSNISYNVEFTFDADAQVAITIYYQAMEEFLDGCASYTSKDSSLQSETVRYKRGVCQHFCLPTHTIDPSDWMDEELACNADSTVYPMVIHAVVDEGEEHLGHSHVLLNTFDKNADGNCSVKPLKQKQVVDGVSYLLQEIYGIENKYNGLQCKVPSDELSDNSAECVVCLSDIRDTLILPCRHLCLCNACADTLRYQANNCPICRLPFRALLQIRAMRKKVDPLPPDHPDPVIASHLPVSDDQPSSDHIPRGYEVVSLLEALNGPLSPPSAPPMHPVRDGSAPCPKPSRGPEEQTPSQGSSSPLDQGTEVCTGLQAKESESRPVSQNSLVLVDKEEGRCRSEGDIPGVLQGHFQEVEDTGMTPESENVTLSSPGVMEPSSHSPTVLSSSITSPEDPSSLTPSVMSMASFQLSTDTMSSMSGSYSFHDDGSLAECDPTQHPTLLSVEEQEGNAVAKDPHRDTVQDSRLHGWWDRRALTPVCDNNNELPRMATLDNDPCLDGTAAGPAVCDDRSNPWPPVSHNTEQEQAADPSPMYGPLAM